MRCGPYQFPEKLILLTIANCLIDKTSPASGFELLPTWQDTLKRYPSGIR